MPPWRSRKLGRPWQIGELRWPWRVAPPPKIFLGKLPISGGCSGAVEDELDRASGGKGELRAYELITQSRETASGEEQIKHRWG